MVDAEFVASVALAAAASLPALATFEFVVATSVVVAYGAHTASFAYSVSIVALGNGFSGILPLNKRLDSSP